MDRLSGLTATVHWIPLTPDEAKGILTQLQIAYLPTNNRECSQFISNDSDIMYIKGNLFVQSEVNITDLRPDTEYCIAIEVSTIAGHSGFSEPMKLTCKLVIFFRINDNNITNSLQCLLAHFFNLGSLFLIMQTVQRYILFR